MFENTRGQKSMIDYILINRDIYLFKLLDIRILISANTITNYHLLLAKIRNNIRKTRKKHFNEKFNIESLSDDSTKYIYQKRFEENKK
jgi:hypothetical protein